MKTVFFSILILMIGSLSLEAEQIAGNSKKNSKAAPGIIITYPGWRLKALSFSYDDANIADRRLVAIFNKYGMKATFHIPSGWLKTNPKNRITEKEIPSLYDGHEISGHGANHRVMSRLSEKSLNRELDEELQAWQRIIGKKVTGYAYPYGRYSQQVINVLKKKGYIYARPVRKITDFNLPTDFFLWSPQAHHNQNIARWGKRYLAFKPQKLSVLLIWGHSYEFNKKNNWHVIEDFCKMMSGKNEIFYATMNQIARYAAAVRTLQFAADGKSMKNISGQKIYFIHNGKNCMVEPGKTVSF